MMKKSTIYLFICVFGLASGSLACTKKKPEPSEGLAPSPSAQVPPGEQAKAQGTADTTKPPETKPASGGATGCTYTTNPATIALQWTAYKYTDKAPVKGSFNTTNIKGPTSANSLAALAEGLQMQIDGASIESGDPGRNITVKDFFFKKFNPPFKMEAIVKNLKGSDAKGNLMIEVNMNGVTKEVPFEYTADPQGNLVAKGGINLMNWNLQKAFDSIHKACETLHTGEDGVAKTWEVVDLELKGKYSKTCPQ